MVDIQKVKRGLRRKCTIPLIVPSDYLSTGSTTLNLACSGSPDWGFVKGYYVNLVGDSKSGKTFLSLTCLAEAAANKNFKEHRFIYDNAELGALMDIERFFGSRVADRMEPPARDKDGPVFSSTIQDFYYHVDDANKFGRPYIYILDSMDALDSDEDAKKFDQRKRARRGKEITEDEKKSSGSYGTSKAKLNSTTLRRLITPLNLSGSILIIISQTRDSFKFGYGQKTRAGGYSLLFYATLEIWCSIKHQIIRTIKGKKRQLGVNCSVRVSKNRIKGYDRTIQLPIYHSFGIDDLGGCVQYLVDEKHWRKTKEGIILAGEFSLKARQEKIIKHIEENDMEKDLRYLVAEVWDGIEEACKLDRKSRY